MPLIEVRTTIEAPMERCFDLACSIDFHVFTSRESQERVVGGRTTGLVGLDEVVTWRGKHFGLWQELTVQVTAFDRPHHFQDVMLSGAFASMRHDHHFETREGMTVALDGFFFRSPLGPLGKLADLIFLRRHMSAFLCERAALLKSAAESEEWRPFLKQ